MTESRGRLDASSCFVCGPTNPIGLNLKFRLQDDICLSEFTPDPNHCGYDGITHGGIIFCILDDVMANWLFLKGIRGYTAKCDVRFKHPLPTECRILLEGRCVKVRSKLVLMEGKAARADNGLVVAESNASFMIE
ncbi:MAG: PaaI family thioesterase [Pseudomonadales bacterium]|nr:PaaI family thioesterase [Pseudomonadales bacterium]